MTRAALQRQYRHLVALLVEEDVAAIRRALDSKPARKRPLAETDPQLLHWTEKLLSDDESQVSAFVDRYPECDRTQLRRLLRTAKKERALDKKGKTGEKLASFLRGCTGKD